MRSALLWFGIAAIGVLLCSTVYGAEANDASAWYEGLSPTVWGLGSDAYQEARIGLKVDDWNVEPFVSGLHYDADGDSVEGWGARAGVLLHALTAEMLGKILGASTTLPDGALYAGPFIEYSDRDEEASWDDRFVGGYVVGGMVDLSGLSKATSAMTLVTEYQSTIWRCSENEHRVDVGVRMEF